MTTKTYGSAKLATITQKRTASRLNAQPYKSDTAQSITQKRTASKPMVLRAVNSWVKLSSITQKRTASIPGRGYGCKGD